MKVTLTMSRNRGIGVSDDYTPELDVMTSLVKKAYHGKQIRVPKSYVFQTATRFITAFDGDNLIGIMPISQRDNGDMTISALAVDPMYEGMGIGHQMVARAIAMYGHARIATETAGSGVSFFEKCGFVYDEETDSMIYQSQAQLQTFENSLERVG